MPETEASYKLKLENYYGPLDLLLYLVKEEELDVLRVRLSDVVEQYIAFIEAAKEVDLQVAGDFLVISSQLMLIKSRKVVPQLQGGEEGEAAEEEEGISIELIRKLLEYRRFKDLARGLEARFDEFSRRHGRPRLRLKEEEDSGEMLRELDLWQIVSSYARVLKQVKIDISLNIVYQDIPIEKIIHNILARVRERVKVPFWELVDRSNKADVIGNFLALLELVKQQLVDFQQTSDRGEIIITLKRTDDGL